MPVWWAIWLYCTVWMKEIASNTCPVKPLKQDPYQVLMTGRRNKPKVYKPLWRSVCVHLYIGYHFLLYCMSLPQFHSLLLFVYEHIHKFFRGDQPLFVEERHLWHGIQSRSVRLSPLVSTLGWKDTDRYPVLGLQSAMRALLHIPLLGGQVHLWRLWAFQDCLSILNELCELVDVFCFVFVPTSDFIVLVSVTIIFYVLCVSEFL